MQESYEIESHPGDRILQIAALTTPRFFSELSGLVAGIGLLRLEASWLWQASSEIETTISCHDFTDAFPFPDKGSIPLLLWTWQTGKIHRQEIEMKRSHFVINVSIGEEYPGTSARILISLVLNDARLPNAMGTGILASLVAQLTGAVREFASTMLAAELDMARRIAKAGAATWAILADRRILWRSPAAAALELALFKSKAPLGAMTFADKLGQSGLNDALRALHENSDRREARFVVHNQAEEDAAFLICRLRKERSSSPWLQDISWFEVSARAPDLNVPAIPDVFRVFGLTPKEAALAAELYNGGTLLTYAKSRGVSHETARSQSKRLMIKLNVKKQSQLIRLLAHIAG
jgi:DNA-binding CsgD family transcriptional regulator